MTLLDAPKYDPAHDRRVRNLLITVGVSILLIAVIGVGPRGLSVLERLLARARRTPTPLRIWARVSGGSVS